MKKILSKILISAIIIITIFGVFGVGGVGVVSAEEETFNVNTLNCASWTGFEIGGCIAIVSYHVLYTTSSWVLSTSGSIFNSLLSFSISREMMNASFVNDAWNALRGVAILLFILVLVAVSISIMLNFGQFNSKEIIRDVVIIALFVNFSLFAARVVIDVGNITALGFYDAIQSQPIDSSGANIDTSILKIQEKDVAGSIMASFNPARMLSPTSFRAWKTEHEQNNNWGAYASLIFIFVLAAIINFYTAYLFFKAGFIFVVRVVYLWVIMATAPLAFISYIIPDLKGKVWKKWWSDLIDKSFCIVAFLFWIWLTLMIVQNDFFKSAFLVNEAEDFSVIRFVTMVLLQFMIVITLLGKSIKYTEKLCDDGGLGNFAFGAVKTAASFAIPSVAGAKTGAAALKALGGVAARETVGRGAGLVAKGLEKTGVGTGRMGRTLLQSTRAIEKAKFGTQESVPERTERVKKEAESYLKTLPKTSQEKFVKTMAGTTANIPGVSKVIPGLTFSSPLAFVMGQRGGEKKFADDYKKLEETKIKIKDKTEKELKPAQRDLERAKDNLKIIKESGATPTQIDMERDKVFDAQQKVDKVKEDVKKLNEDSKLKK